MTSDKPQVRGTYVHYNAFLGYAMGLHGHIPAQQAPDCLKHEDFIDSSTPYGTVGHIVLSCGQIPMQSQSAGAKSDYRDPLWSPAVGAFFLATY